LLQEACVGGDYQAFSKNISGSAENICFERKSKVIIMVVDALKYEFGLYNENLKNPLPYQNQLPVLKNLLKSHPDHTRLLKFVADPPTTTLQRLKGITTGSFPTFIDIGSNFATPEINEDNVIDQIVLNNMTAVFLGDSTWTELFPKRFKRSHPLPSFNIHDLDSVDNGKNMIFYISPGGAHIQFLFSNSQETARRSGEKRLGHNNSALFGSRSLRSQIRPETRGNVTKAVRNEQCHRAVCGDD
jgi:predicted AlkP superfamily pyrophosphatase or phosphodiesterase